MLGTPRLAPHRDQNPFSERSRLWHGLSAVRRRVNCVHNSQRCTGRPRHAAAERSLDRLDDLSPALDGIGLLPILTGEPENSERPFFLRTDWAEFGRQRAVRRGRWKSGRRRFPTIGKAVSPNKPGFPSSVGACALDFLEYGLQIEWMRIVSGF
jgi:hypothetical protein